MDDRQEGVSTGSRPDTLTPARGTGILTAAVSVALVALLWACAGPMAQWTAPEAPFAEHVYLIERDYTSTWHALLRVFHDLPRGKIAEASPSRGRIVLQDVEVPVPGHCDCGRMGKKPLDGNAVRTTRVRINRQAPQQTRLVIRCTYQLDVPFEDIYGKKVRVRTVECASSGRFEGQIHRRVLRLLQP